MDKDTGERGDRRARMRIVYAVAAGALVMGAGFGFLWWQDWGFGFGLGWLTAKLGVKAGFFVAAGGVVGLLAWLRKRQPPPQEKAVDPAA